VGRSSSEDVLRRLLAENAIEARERFRRGEAVVGGKWWENDPARNYCDASRVLVQESERRGTFEPLVLPIIFLQRHTVELTLKTLARVAHNALDAMEHPLEKPKFDKDHRLAPWLDHVKAAVDAVGLPVPPAAALVVEALERVGDREGQEWRYSRVQRKNGPAEPAFPIRKNLPVRELQGLVEAFVHQSFGDEGPGGAGLFWDLGAIADTPSLVTA
jgi:hypothetical protein